MACPPCTRDGEAAQRSPLLCCTAQPAATPCPLPPIPAAAPAVVTASMHTPTQLCRPTSLPHCLPSPGCHPTGRPADRSRDRERCRGEPRQPRLVELRTAGECSFAPRPGHAQLRVQPMGSRPAPAAALPRLGTAAKPDWSLERPLASLPPPQIIELNLIVVGACCARRCRPGPAALLLVMGLASALGCCSARGPCRVGHAIRTSGLL